MIDATFPVKDQREWIEEELKNSLATWKFAVFHFPPYNFEAPYPEIQQEWVTLVDEYHVDMVFSGHIHYYIRSKPMREGKPASSFDRGTVYVTSIGTRSDHDDMGWSLMLKQGIPRGLFINMLKLTGIS